MFVDCGGVYLIIDVIYECVFPIQHFYLGVLVDLVEDTHSISQLVTWRGKRKEDVFLHLLCQLWRKWENIIQAKRDKYGCILDIEEPLKGKCQSSLPKFENSSIISVLDMQCCIRPKIFAIISMLQNVYTQTTAIIEESYNFNLRDISHEDKITLKIIEYYECFKEGEIWWELWNKFLDVGKENTLLPLAASALHHLAIKQVQWARFIQEEQNLIVKSCIKEELKLESELYKKLKSCRLSRALAALKQIDYEMRTSDYDFLKKSKSSQVKAIAENYTPIDGARHNELSKNYYFQTNITTMTAGRKPILGDSIIRSSNLDYGVFERELHGVDSFLGSSLGLNLIDFNRKFLKEKHYKTENTKEVREDSNFSV